MIKSFTRWRMVVAVVAFTTASIGPLNCLFAQAVSATAPNVRESGNPMLSGADPHAAVFGNSVWVYPTFSVGRQAAFYAFTSENLVAWKRLGPVLDFKNVKWINDDGRTNHGAWAPCIVQNSGTFYFYYSVGDQSSTPSRIGVAVGNSPAGPFVDSGKPLLTGMIGQFEAIDPMVFIDPKSGTPYLYAGGSAGAKLRVYELTADMVALKQEIDVKTPPEFTEGAFMHERNGTYYLTYSHGYWRGASYSVHYATADSPTGPWTYRGAILTSDAKRKGPGHHSIIQNPADGAWYIIYHRWDNQSGDGPYRGQRRTCIERMTYTADGLIEPIVMTNTGVPATSFASTRPAGAAGR